MTTESRMREALEKIVSLDFASTPVYEDFERAIGIAREALSPPARRTSYEWVDEHGDLARVRWSNEQRRWIAEMIPPGCRSYHVYGGSAHYSFAAAIARLAGLEKEDGS